MLCILLNVLAHHLWVQFLKSTLFYIKEADLSIFLEFQELPTYKRVVCFRMRDFLCNNFVSSSEQETGHIDPSLSTTGTHGLLMDDNTEAGVMTGQVTSFLLILSLREE